MTIDLHMKYTFITFCIFKEKFTFYSNLVEKSSVFSGVNKTYLSQLTSPLQCDNTLIVMDLILAENTLVPTFTPLRSNRLQDMNHLNM